MSYEFPVVKMLDTQSSHETLLEALRRRWQEKIVAVDEKESRDKWMEDRLWSEYQQDMTDAAEERGDD